MKWAQHESLVRPGRFARGSSIRVRPGSSTSCAVGLQAGVGAEVGLGDKVVPAVNAAPTMRARSLATKVATTPATTFNRKFWIFSLLARAHFLPTKE